MTMAIVSKDILVMIYQNPQLITSVPHVNDCFSNIRFIALKDGMNIARKVKAVPVTNPFMEYGTCAHKNSRKVTMIMRFEVAYMNSERSDHL